MKSSRARRESWSPVKNQAGTVMQPMNRAARRATMKVNDLTFAPSPKLKPQVGEWKKS